MTYLLLKWGTIKAWDFEGDKKLQELMRQYRKEGVSLSVIMHEDTPKQKQLICKMIDRVDEIQNDWTGKKMNKQEAKEYVLNWDKKEEK